MRIRTGNYVAADLDRTRASPCAAEQVGQVFDRRVERHHLEDRAGDRVCQQQTVDVHAFPSRVLRVDGGRVGRVKGRGRNHAQDLARLVVVHTHRAAHPAQRLIGDVVEVSVDGQIQVVARAERRIYAGQQVVAGQLIRECGQRTRTDVARRVAHRVQRGATNVAVRIIGAVAVLVQRGEHITVPVKNSTALELAGIAVQMPVIGIGGPVAPVYNKLEAENSQSEAEQRRQDQAEHTAFFDFPHLVHLPAQFAP